MPKSPAVLFYTADFLVGTTFLTFEQRGQYILLLCQQHQLGHITEQHLIEICGSIDNPVIAKFIRDEKGLFYNERMELEESKRNKWTASRQLNLKGKKKVSHMGNHMGNHMENDNDNDNNNNNKNNNGSTKQEIIDRLKALPVNEGKDIDKAVRRLEAWVEKGPDRELTESLLIKYVSRAEKALKDIMPEKVIVTPEIIEKKRLAKIKELEIHKQTPAQEKETARILAEIKHGKKKPVAKKRTRVNTKKEVIK